MLEGVMRAEVDLVAQVDLGARRRSRLVGRASRKSVITRCEANYSPAGGVLECKAFEGEARRRKARGR